MGQFYRDYADYLAERFEGKVQKLTVNAGFSCPNRDGTLGRGGCVYCNNVSFSPQIAAGDVVRQLEEGKRFLRVNILTCAIWPTSRAIRTHMAPSKI